MIGTYDTYVYRFWHLIKHERLQNNVICYKVATQNIRFFSRSLVLAIYVIPIDEIQYIRQGCKMKWHAAICTWHENHVLEARFKLTYYNKGINEIFWSWLFGNMSALDGKRWRDIKSGSLPGNRENRNEPEMEPERERERVKLHDNINNSRMTHRKQLLCMLPYLLMHSFGIWLWWQRVIPVCSSIRIHNHIEISNGIQCVTSEELNHKKRGSLSAFVLRRNSRKRAKKNHHSKWLRHGLLNECK